MAVACRASSQRTEGTRSHSRSWWWRTSRTGGSRMHGELRAWLACWPRRSVPPVQLPRQVLLPAAGACCSMLILMTAGCLPCHSQGPQLCLAANSLKFGNSLASELTCGRWPPGNLSAPFRDRATLHLVAIKSVTDAYHAWCDRDHGHWPIVHAEQICMKLKMHRVLLHLSEADAAGPGDIRISSVPSTQHQWLHQTAFKKRSHMGKHYCAAAVERRCIVS